MESGIAAATLAMGQIADAAPVDESGQSAAPWEQVAGRVADYLRALGVTDPLHLERLGLRIRERFEARVGRAKLEDPVEAAIEVTYALLDRWLSAELGIVGDRDALFTARAAVLSGAVPGWAARFAGVSEESCAAAIHAAGVQPRPPDAPLTMVPNTIELFWRRVGRAIAAGLRRLIGLLPGDAAADPHQVPPR